MTKKPSRHVNWRQLIFERDDYTCYLCGKKFPKEQLEVDHKYPLSRGGKNSYSNLKTACRSCNRKKHDKIIETQKNIEITKEQIAKILIEQIEIKEKQRLLLEQNFKLANDSFLFLKNKFI